MNLMEAQDKTTVLQSSLYKAATERPSRRFHALYDKLVREDVLLVAWSQVKANRGAPGIDGVTIDAISKGDVPGYLSELAQELKEKRYRPRPVRRVEIPKDGGKVRILGVPCVRDRIVQAAAKLLLEPIFEADFAATSFGFRPGIGQPEALANVQGNAYRGYRYVVDADIEGFFDHLAHEKLMDALRRRISDGAILRLIWRWLKAGVLVFGDVEDTDEGTPQGGVLSPLLANVYLHGMDQAFAEMRPRLGVITRYADDFVIQCGTLAYAERALHWVREHLTEQGLRLNEAKTRIVADSGGFDFLSFHHRRVPTDRGEGFLRWPSKKACQRFRDRFCAAMRRKGFVQTAADHAEVIERVVRYMAGWRAYFRNGQSTRVFRKLDHYVCERLARYQARCQPTGKRRKRRSWQTFVGPLKANLKKLSTAQDWPTTTRRGGANVRWRAV